MAFPHIKKIRYENCIKKGLLGQNTKGLTSVNRLRQIDNFVCMEFAYLFHCGNPIFVDVGFGENPITTIESHKRLKNINPGIKVIGVEIDNKRLQTAKPYEQTGVEFRLGGFNLPLHKEEKANIIRCYNVLRQYSESDFQTSIIILSNYLINGGVLLEGTSDQFGRLVAFNIFHKRENEIYHEYLVFGTNFNSNLYPRDFQSVLPRNFIQHVTPDNWLYRFFDDWMKSYYSSLGNKSQRQIFYESAIKLRKEHGYKIDLKKGLLKRGFLKINMASQNFTLL